MEDQDILSYGIGMTTLEEVFLKCNRTEGGDEADQIEPVATSNPTSDKDKRTDEMPTTAPQITDRVKTEGLLINDDY